MPHVKQAVLILISVQFFVTAVRAEESAKMVRLEAQLVAAYSDHRCNEMAKMIKPEEVPTLRPNVMAVVASCDLPGFDPEKIFELAEKKDDRGDLIVALHALHRQTYDPEGARPLWKKVLMFARNDSLRNLAREFLSGQRHSSRTLNLSSTTWDANLDLGTSEHSSPWFQELPYLQTQSSEALDIDLKLKAQHWTKFGSISASYETQQSRYFSAQQETYVNHLVETPISLRVGKREDVIFTPFFGQTTVGGEDYQAQYGLKFSGVVYRETYKQSVQGFVSSEDNKIDNVGPDRQAHYHFDYDWEFFPDRWLVAGKFFMDDISGAETDRFLNTPGAFNNSYALFGIDGFVRRGFGMVTLGLKPRISTRIDSHDSSYVNTLGDSIAKRRIDRTIDLEPHVILKLAPQLQLFLYYRISATMSSVGETDYANRSHVDHVAGLTLRTYWSSY